jgi:hypothetical protein
MFAVYKCCKDLITSKMSTASVKFYPFRNLASFFLVYELPIWYFSYHLDFQINGNECTRWSQVKPEKRSLLSLFYIFVCLNKNVCQAG